MNILFIVKVKILELIQWSYNPLQLCRLLNFEWLTKLEHIVQSLLKHMLFWCLFLDLHLTINCSSLGV